jgi:transposase
MKAEITIPLDLPEVKVLQTEITDHGQFVITVESRLEGTKCHQCGREIKQAHGLDNPISLRHLPILGRPTYIRLRPKRYRCPYCKDEPTTTQQLSWYVPKSPHTRAYEQYILLQLVNSTLEDVALKEEIGVKAIEGIIDRHLRCQVNWKEIRRAKILGLDEIALKKGHDDFVVLVRLRTADGAVHLVAVLADRKKETVRRFLESLPKRIKRSLKTVCTDLYEGSVEAVKAVLGQVQIVVDRFHLAKLYRACADQLRKQETKRLKKELPKAEYVLLLHKGNF